MAPGRRKDGILLTEHITAADGTPTPICSSVVFTPHWLLTSICKHVVAKPLELLPTFAIGLSAVSLFHAPLVLAEYTLQLSQH